MKHIPMYAKRTSIALFCFHMLSLYGLRLDSHIIAIADGKLVNANTFELMIDFYRDILYIMQGNPQDKTAPYIFGEKSYGTLALAAIEKKITTEQDLYTSEAFEQIKTTLEELLIQAKDDLDRHAEKFKRIRGPKHMMALLIESSCKLRGICSADSIFLRWAHVKEEVEEEYFDQEISSFEAFNHFCKDLINFLNDMMESCPKAREQLRQRKDKWSRIKMFLQPIIAASPEEYDYIWQNNFLRYIKFNIIDDIKIQNITANAVETMVAQFNAYRSQEPTSSKNMLYGEYDEIMGNHEDILYDV